MKYLISLLLFIFSSSCFAVDQTTDDEPLAATHSQCSGVLKDFHAYLSDFLSSKKKKFQWSLKCIDNRPLNLSYEKKARLCLDTTDVQDVILYRKTLRKLRSEAAKKYLNSLQQKDFVNSCIDINQPLGPSSNALKVKANSPPNCQSLQRGFSGFVSANRITTFRYINSHKSNLLPHERRILIKFRNSPIGRTINLRFVDDLRTSKKDIQLELQKNYNSLIFMAEALQGQFSRMGPEKQFKLWVLKSQFDQFIKNYDQASLALKCQEESGVLKDCTPGAKGSFAHCSRRVLRAGLALIPPFAVLGGFIDHHNNKAKYQVGLTNTEEHIVAQTGASSELVLGAGEAVGGGLIAKTVLNNPLKGLKRGPLLPTEKLYPLKFPDLKSTTPDELLAEANSRVRRYKINHVLRTSVSRHNQDLPEPAKKMLRKIKNKVQETKFSKDATLRKTNGLTSRFAKEREFQDFLPKQDPLMSRGLIDAYQALHSKQPIADYFEDLAAAGFRRMLQSGSEKLLKKAEQGKLDHDTMIEVLKERHANRGLRPSLIEPKSEILSQSEFQRKIAQGPLIDRGFEPGESLKQNHGVYVHFVQLDFITPYVQRHIGDRPISELYDYFGTDQGLAYWNETFDQYFNTQSIRDTNFLNGNFFDMLQLKHPDEYL